MKKSRPCESFSFYVLRKKQTSHITNVERAFQEPSSVGGIVPKVRRGVKAKKVLRHLLRRLHATETGSEKMMNLMLSACDAPSASDSTGIWTMYRFWNSRQRRRRVWGKHAQQNLDSSRIIMLSRRKAQNRLRPVAVVVAHVSIPPTWQNGRAWTAQCVRRLHTC
jgi:hypothetical protein